ncbi:MAG: hypothetical protein ABUL62_23960 [Myxococcales bacterium]
MPLSFSRSTASIALAAFLAAQAAPAHADNAASSYSLQACALAYENSQEHRRAGALLVARAELARCAQDDCPEFIRNDCTQWSKETEAEQPTVLLSAKRGGRELNDVRVSLGDRVLAERLPSQAIALDPGSYELQFEAPGSAVLVQQVVIRAGEKNQLVQVDLAPPPAPPAAPLQPAGAPIPSATLRSDAAAPSGARRVLPWALLGVGAASLGAGVGFALWGHSNENQLRASCSPICSDSEVRPVRTKYLLGDVSLGVGLVSASLAAYLFLSHSASEPSAASGLPVSVVAGPSSVLATYGARF